MPLSRRRRGRGSGEHLVQGRRGRFCARHERRLKKLPLSWSAGTCIRADKTWPPCGRRLGIRDPFMSTLVETAPETCQALGRSAATCWFSSAPVFPPCWSSYSRCCRCPLMTTVRQPDYFSAIARDGDLKLVSEFRRSPHSANSGPRHFLQQHRVFGHCGEERRYRLSGTVLRQLRRRPRHATRCHRCSISSRSTTWHSSVFVAESFPAG